MTENDGILETESGNSSPSSNLKQKRETQTEPSSNKVVLTGYSMVNGISEKGLSVNHKVKPLNFPGVSNEKILEKLDDMINDHDDITRRSHSSCWN